MTKPRETQGRMLRIKDLVQMLGIGRSSIYRLMKIGEFPAPISLGVRTTCWPEAEIHEGLEAKGGRRILLTSPLRSSTQQESPSQVTRSSSDDDIVGLTALLLKGITEEALKDQRGRGRPRHAFHAGSIGRLSPDNASPSLESVTAENTILRRLLIEALVQLERLRTGTRLGRQ